MSLTAWLDHLQPGAGARLGPMLRALPGRPTFEGPLPEEPEARALACLEWSAREGAPGLRLACTLDTERLPRGWLTAVFRRLHPELPAAVVAEAEALRGEGVGMLVGLDAGEALRAKLYVYPEGRRAPVDRLLKLAGLDPSAWWPAVRPVGLPLPFVAIDLAPGRVDGLKAYLGATDRAQAAAALELLGGPTLAAQARALPPEIEQDAHALVVTPRWRGAAQVDLTLHARVHRVDVAPLLRPALAGELAALTARASSLGLRLAPTHVSWLSGGAQTVYYQLVAMYAR